jgi:hypothetical protein
MELIGKNPQKSPKFEEESYEILKVFGRFGDIFKLFFF